MAEKEYIERNVLVETLNRLAPQHYDCVINGVIMAQDTADVAPVKHGHWESNEYLAGIHMTRCSECKAEFYIQDLEEISGDGFVNYCPNCGAKMDGGEENE